MRVAIHILLFILFFVSPFAMGLYLMDPPPAWLGGMFKTDATKPRQAKPDPGSGREKELSPAAEPAAPAPSAASPIDAIERRIEPAPEEPQSVKLRRPTVALDSDDIGQEQAVATAITAQDSASDKYGSDGADEETDDSQGHSASTNTAEEDQSDRSEPEPRPASQEKRLRRPIPDPIRPLAENPRYFQYALASREEFDQMARRDNVPGALGVRELKVLIAGVDTASPIQFFLNTGRFPYHYCFVRDLLHPGMPHSRYKNATYYKETGRKFLAVSLVAHDNYRNEDGSTGAYIVSFWPTDPVGFDYVSLVYDLIVDNMNFEHGHVYYQPSGTMQEELYHAEKYHYAAAELPVMLAADFYSNFSFSPLNTGTSYGRLLMADPTSTYSARDIVVFKTLPNDLSVAAGIITEAPQTPLSHVNLKAQQNGIPNAYIRGATTDETLLALAGEYVRYEVTADGWRATRASPDEVDAFLEASRPPASPPPPSDLNVTSIVPLSSIGFHDATAFGAKAANVAELGEILPEGTAPRGFAVPFFFYDEFMKHNRLHQESRRMIADETFRADATERRARLKAFRAAIKDAEAPEWMLIKLGAVQRAFPKGLPLRCRSSTNNEDMEGFNGAGLYDSYTHRKDEGHIIKSMKQVWASLWTYRAFEEREFYRVDHSKVYMGVLLHPNYDDEQANGVGITRNIFDPRWLGFYVNVQVGENLITNPDEESTPEEFLVSVMTGGPQDQAYTLEIQYSRRSDQVPRGDTVLTRPQAIDLARNMRVIHRHFRDLYEKHDDDTFAMDIEFKIDVDGLLVIKQARPWVWPNLPPAEDTDC